MIFILAALELACPVALAAAPNELTRGVHASSRLRLCVVAGQARFFVRACDNVSYYIRIRYNKPSRGQISAKKFQISRVNKKVEPSNGRCQLSSGSVTSHLQQMFDKALRYRLCRSRLRQDPAKRRLVRVGIDRRRLLFFAQICGANFLDASRFRSEPFRRTP